MIFNKAACYIELNFGGVVYLEKLMLYGVACSLEEVLRGESW